MTDKSKPLLDPSTSVVNQELRQISLVAALPDGEAFIDNWSWDTESQKVLRLNAQGQVTKTVHEAFGWPRKLGGLLLSHQYLFVIYQNGTLVEINVNSSQTVDVYPVHNVSLMFNYGSLAYDPSVIPDHDLLLLTDARKGQVFSYRLSSRKKVIHVTQLKYPTSVSYVKYKSTLYYVVTDKSAHEIFLYNTKWSLYKSLGNGQLNGPYSALGMSNGIVIAVDTYNDHVSEYSINGKFIRHLLTESDGVRLPNAISIHLPYLWVVNYLGENVVKYNVHVLSVHVQH